MDETPHPQSDDTDDSEFNKIPQTFNQYRIIAPLHSEATSRLFLVQNVINRQQYACKIISRSNLTTEKQLEKFDRECRLMVRLRHPNIVTLYDAVYDPMFIYMILEYCPYGDLFDYLVTKGPMPLDQAVIFFKQIVEALAYVHSKNIAHRDLKPENVLIGKDKVPKLSDFGLSRETNGNKLLSTPCGTTFYVAPEVLSETIYDGKKADIWSIGVVLYFILIGKLPWTSQNATELFKQISNAEYSFPRTIHPLCRELIGQLLHIDPDKRPTAEEILTNPWLSDPKQLIQCISDYPSNAIINMSELPSLNSAPRSQINRQTMFIRKNKLHRSSMSAAPVFVHESILRRPVPLSSTKRYERASFIHKG